MLNTYLINKKFRSKSHVPQYVSVIGCIRYRATLTHSLMQTSLIFFMATSFSNIAFSTNLSVFLNKKLSSLMCTPVSRRSQVTSLRILAIVYGVSIECGHSVCMRHCVTFVSLQHILGGLKAYKPFKIDSYKIIASFHTHV